MERKNTRSSKKTVEQKMREQHEHIFVYLEVRNHDKIEAFMNQLLENTGVSRAEQDTTK